MKRTTTIIFSVAVCCAVSAQTNIANTYTSAEWGAHNSTCVTADLNGDGTKEIIVAGVSANATNYGGSQDYEKNRLTHVIMYKSNVRAWRAMGFSSVNTVDYGLNFNVADRPSISVGDINQDGILDVAAFETTGIHYNDRPYIDGVSQVGLFLGDGDGNFTKFEPSFIDNSGNATTFNLNAIMSADLADFNNDGLLDIVGIGYQTNSSGVATSFYEANVVLLNQGGGVFKVTHFLTDQYVKDYEQDGKAYHFEIGEVYSYDFNNDGYVDFFVNAQSNDRAVLGVSNGTEIHFSDLFLNDPQHPGQFKRQFLNDNSWSSPLPQMAEGGLAIADYNNDGTPDIFFSGWTGSGRTSYKWSIYKNEIDNGGYVNLTDLGHNGLPEMRNQNSTSTQYGAYDWDGDGNYDIFNLGWSTANSTQTCFISKGAGDGTFTVANRIGGGSEASLAFVDWNNDGVNDFITTGGSGDKTFYSSASGYTNYFSATINPNTTGRTTPDAPTLNAPTVTGEKVNLSWTDAASSKKNVTYEYYVTNEARQIVAGGNAIISGEKSGIRKVNQPGNAYNARAINLYLPNGKYTYGVQTVDASYIGSAFATGTFEITASEKTVPARVTNGTIGQSAAKTYKNPIIATSLPDPTVIKADDGLFYLYATEDIHNVPIYCSNNLIDWDFVGTCFTDATRPQMVSGGGIWAPDINYFNDKYVLYYSKSVWGGESTCGIGVATASKPEGPFIDHGKLFISNEIGVTNSIDPFFIEDNGHKYLFWGSFRGIYAIELSDDGLSIKSGATKQQIAGTLTEATYIIKHDGYFYLIGSAGTCCDGANSTYRLMMARSKNVLGPYVNKLGEATINNGFSNLLYRNGLAIGPGHNAEFVQDDAGQYWVIYHGFKAADVDAGRNVFMDKVEWGKDGWPIIKNMQPSFCSDAPLFGTTGIKPTIADSKNNDGVSISPKRITDNVRIDVADGATFTWQLVNCNGEVAKKGQAKGSVLVNAYDIRSGLYIISVKGKKISHSEKVIKH